MTEEERIRRAQHAERLLADDLFKEMIGKARDHALEKFKQAKPADLSALANARTYYDVTETFINDLNSVVNDGKIAQRNAELKKPTRAK